MSTRTFSVYLFIIYNLLPPQFLIASHLHDFGLGLIFCIFIALKDWLIQRPLLIVAEARTLKEKTLILLCTPHKAARKGSCTAAQNTYIK